MNQELKESQLETMLFPLETSARMFEVLKIRACARAAHILVNSERTRFGLYRRIRNRA